MPTYLLSGDVVPISPTEAAPDLSRLRLIKDSELKKSEIIGSGAFGTVFRVSSVARQCYDNHAATVPHRRQTSWRVLVL